MRIPNHLWRWIGGVALTGAVIMMVLGLSVIQSRLNAGTFIAWWGACFLLTVLAMLAAFLDLRQIGLRSRDQHRELLETTLRSIDSDAIKKKSRSTKPPSNGK